MSSGEESDSPRPYSRGDSHKSLPKHDSLRELSEADKKRRMKKREQDDHSGDDRPESSNNNNNNNTHRGQSDMDLINGSPRIPPVTSDSIELLDSGGAERKNTLPGKGDKDTVGKKTNIIAMGDIELQPVEKGGKEVAPLPPPKEKKKKSKKLKKLLRMKPKVVENKPRQVYFNNAVKNASYGYAKNSISTTKYTILTFIPKNLFEQFRRAANFYFLVIAMIQLIPGLSSTSAYSSIVPLIIVLAVSAIKEGIEDWKRYLSDRDTNNYPCTALRDGEFRKIPWSQVAVGDILKVHNGERLPADLVLLNSSENQGLCYVETSNLDGETNLKLHQAIPETVIIGENPGGLNSFEGVYVECEGPNNRLYNFNGFVDMNGTKKSLGVKQVLLRGCLLKNTQWIIGFVVYTGSETKLMQNATSPPSKRTTLERKTNQSLAFIFAFMTMVCLTCAIAGGVWTRNTQIHHWYIPARYSPAVTGVAGFFTFLISFSVMIPISLYVSMELVKVAQALFIGQDLEMYHEETDTPAKARTSNLSEELGQVEYIFSDKTGTLTRNMMEFFKCSIGGVSYGTGYTEIAIAKAKREERTLPQMDTVPLPNVDPKFAFNDHRIIEDMKTKGQGEKIIEFFTLLAICHTVIPERDAEADKIVYQAASPDEATLVDAARQLGFFFHTRNPRDIICNILGEDIQYIILNVLEFNSTRKRMSVITKDHSTGKIRLYCKGADTVIFERLKEGQDELKEKTLDNLEDFASDGLRTLCLAWREIDEAEYTEWSKVFDEASVAIQERDLKLMQAAELIEKELILIGATAIEDKLQVGVPDAIYTLAQAEIKIWVLTGDHQETAINIGFACSLLTASMTILIVNARDPEETERQLIAAIQHSDDPEGEYGLVIDGTTLQHALDPARNQRLLQVAKRCAAVICCRVSPLQKAQVVTLVKDNLKVITLAIGDGANDVSMIQQAHIGIGISGQEGMQAVMNSDYAIAQFRFLTRLLLIHGRSDYKRVSKLILYSFYKNMVFSLCQFPFDWYNGFSAQTMFDSWSITIFNIVFTGLPIILYAIFDQDVTPKMIYQYPQMYETGQKNLEFNLTLLFYWLGIGIYQAFVVYFSVYLMYTKGVINSDGQSSDVFFFGAFCFFCVILTVNVRLALETRYFTFLTYIFLFLCPFIWFPWLALEGGVPVFITDSIMYGVGAKLWTAGVFWLGVLFVVVLCMVPVVVIEHLRRQLRPQNYQIVQELKRLARKEREKRVIEMNGGSTGGIFKRKAVRKSMRNVDEPSDSKFTGFAFSPDDEGKDTLNHEFKNQNTSSKRVSAEKSPTPAPSNAQLDKTGKEKDIYLL